MSSETDLDNDPEFAAIRMVYAALKGLDEGTQRRVLSYVAQKLSMDPVVIKPESIAPAVAEVFEKNQAPAGVNSHVEGVDDFEGVSPVAQKWMRRSGLSGKALSSLFSLGIDDIDLIATSVPGKSKAERVHSVALLLGIASYLGSGAARFTDEKFREACGHYDAYDVANFSKHLKAISAEVSGTRELGYTLSSRGISAATELIKKMLNTPQ